MAQKAIVMAVLADLIGKQKDAFKKALDGEMENADRVNVQDPTDPDVRLGMIYRTEPKPSAVVESEIDLMHWHRRHHPDRIEYVKSLDPERMGEIMAIVEARNPDLIRELPVVKDWAREEVLKATVKAREPVGPHGELDDQAPPVRYVPAKLGSIVVKPGSEAEDIIGKLWAQGRIDISTGEILELES